MTEALRVFTHVAAKENLTLSYQIAAGEFGTDREIVFEITRTGDTAMPLTIPLNASGSAIAGTDYAGFITAFTLPAGRASASLVLTVLADDLAEGTETVGVTLGQTDAFVIDGAGFATAALADRPAQQLFHTAITDPARRGATDDPDGDGVPNLVEYFVGSDPAIAGAPSVVETPGTATPLVIRYRRATDRTDVHATVQWSTDLLVWREAGETDGARTVAISQTILGPQGDGRQLIEAAATVTGIETPVLFLRLRVE